MVLISVDLWCPNSGNGHMERAKREISVELFRVGVVQKMLTSAGLNGTENCSADAVRCLNLTGQLARCFIFLLQ